MLAGYTRVSRVGDRAERLVSPEEQEAIIADYCSAQGYAVEMLAPELDVSGGKISRPILDEILIGIESGRFEGIAVAWLDRLSRLGMVDALNLIERIEDAGGRVVAVRDNYDASTAEGELGRNMALSISRMQRRRSSERFANAKARSVRHGIWPLPVVPIGYRVARRKDGGTGVLEPDPETAHLVVRAFERRAAGDSWREVGRLIDRGNTGARKVVANRVYLGEINYGEWRNAAAHPALIERSLFEAAQIDHPRPPRGRHGPALLAGILRCTGCRGLLTPDAEVYRCVQNRADGPCGSPAIISRSVIEPFVVETTLGHIQDLAFHARESTADLSDAAEVLEEAEAELGAFQEGVRVADIGAEHFAEGMRSRVEVVERARRDLAAARLRAAPAVSGELGSTWPKLSVLERRHVLRGALGVVWVRKGRGPVGDRVKITTDVPPGLPRMGFGRTPLLPIAWEDIDGLVEPLAHDPGEGLGGAGA